MDLPSIEDVLRQIDAFLDRHSMTPTRFGAEATGDPNLLTALRGGASPSLRRLHRVGAYMKRKDEQLEHDRLDACCDAATSPGKAGDISGGAAA